MTDATDLAPETHTGPSGTLDRNGRQLAWDEVGDSGGFPVLFFHGAPGCRRNWSGIGPIAAAAGVRLIAPDRPGCGQSDHDPNRRMVDWAADMSALADHLGLTEYGVAGVSGGGPYALACAAGGDRRVRRAGIGAGVGPLDTPERLAGLHEINRGVFQAAAAGPQALVPIVTALAGAGADEGTAAAVMAQMPIEDRQAMAADPTLAELGDMTEVMAHGPEGVAYDLWLYTQPWGFDLDAITVPVDFYNGDHDRNVPVQHAVDMAAAVPNSTLTVWPATGHVSGILRLGEIFGRLTSG